MRIGVVSDTHDRSEAVAEAVRLLLDQQVELVLHCGDIESVETVQLFRPIPTHFVWGNWDKDRAKLAAAVKAIGGSHHDSFGAIELAGKRIAWLHSHERHQFRQLEHSDFFDYLFYGHTHVREQHRTGRTLVANPGALFRANPKTCIVLDVTTGEIKPIIVPVAQKMAHPTLNGAVEAEPEPTGSVFGLPGLGANGDPAAPHPDPTPPANSAPPPGSNPA
jgi:putative phosphoesterase